MVTNWPHLFHEGGRAALVNGPSAAVKRPGRLTGDQIARNLGLRRRFRLTTATIARTLGLACVTVARWPARVERGRFFMRVPAPPVRRDQRARPGARPDEPFSFDVKKLGRLDRPGHRRAGTHKGCRNRGAGRGFAHVAVDDAARLGYVEVLPDDHKESATAFLVCALTWPATRGIGGQRVMTDNGSRDRARIFANLLRDRPIRHTRTRSCTPKTNGKAERFIQTLLRKWPPYRATHASSAARPPRSAATA